MRILAIDPGPTQSAYVIWQPPIEGLPPALYDFGKVSTIEMIQKMQQLDGTKNPLISHVAIEMVASYGMAVGKDVFETVFNIGQFYLYAERVCCWDVARIYRMDIKMHFCHNSRAKDGNIRQALIDRFGPPGVKKSPGLLYGVSKDVWSALAVAVYFADTHKGVEIQ